MYSYRELRRHFGAVITAGVLGVAGLASSSALARDFDIPTGAPRSPTFGAQRFSQPLQLFEEFGTRPVPARTWTCTNCAPLPPISGCDGQASGVELDNFLRQNLWPQPSRESDQTSLQGWHNAVGECVRPLTTSFGEGRPPGEWFSHQRWDEFYPRAFFSSAQAGARVNNGVRDAWQRHTYSVGEFRRNGGLYYNGGTTRGRQVRFHPNFPVQQPNSVWTFDGTMPPKLLMARIGEPILFRHYNALPINPAANNGFGANTITTHQHNGHNPAESDGFASSFFFPGQYYDYHWPLVLAGHDTVNTNASDPRAGYPDGNGGITRIRGDWREIQSTLWFHDHMLDYTAQNVYKGNAAMMNIYSSIDRGREGLNCHYSNANNPNLCFPSGTALDWGNRDYDVNLVLADKAWDSAGQLWFNIFNLDGFLGDQVLVNWTWQPYLDVRARRYRFRILNGSVSRNFQLALVNQIGQPVPFHMIANDGNIMQNAVRFPNSESATLPEQAIAERYDIIIDFSQFTPGAKLYLVNVLEMDDGRRPRQTIPTMEAFNGRYQGDPAVGRIMEFRVNAYGGVDRSMDPAMYEQGGRQMVPLPQVSQAEINAARRRTFEFGRSNNTDEAPWTIRVDGDVGLSMDPHNVAVTTQVGRWEVWEFESGDGWAHPVHVHFEEGRILSRDGRPPPAWERGARKDVFRVGAGPHTSNRVQVLIRFREFLGTYMEHCHNTMHEDHSMLLRWDNRRPGEAVAIPTPIADWEGVYYEPSLDLPTSR